MSGCSLVPLVGAFAKTHPTVQWVSASEVTVYHAALVRCQRQSAHYN